MQVTRRPPGLNQTFGAVTTISKDDPSESPALAFDGEGNAIAVWEHHTATPTSTVLQYAGNGKFSSEEDFWSLIEGTRTMKQYEEACAKFDPAFPKRRTRQNWGSGPDWTQGAATYDLGHA